MGGVLENRISSLWFLPPYSVLYSNTTHEIRTHTLLEGKEGMCHHMVMVIPALFFILTDITNLEADPA